MDSTWRKQTKDTKETKEDSQGGRSRKNFGDKILWERSEEADIKRDNRDNGSYGYGWTGRIPKANRSSKWNYDYSSGPSWGGGDGFKRIITNKFLIQTLVSILIFMIAIGIYDRQDPSSKVASRALQYLLSVDVNLEPIMGRIVKTVFPEITDGVLAPDVNAIKTTGNIGAEQNPSMPVQASLNPKMSLPLTGSIIKGYGWVVDELDGYKRFHEGIDVEAKLGTKVHVVLDGKVIKSGDDKVLGKYVQISHSGSLTTLYAQLEKVLVQEKEQVKEGDIIGQVGQTGAAATPHLHFEVREKGELVDPYNKLTQSGIQ
jgi:murein DD-endopeptidase MepM/ murein hydrolase activator NlpD